VPTGFVSWNTNISPEFTWDVGNIEPDITLSNGNLTAERTTGIVIPYWYGVVSTNAHVEGKKYFEITQDVYSAASIAVGLTTSFLSDGYRAVNPTVNYLGFDNQGWGLRINDPAPGTSVGLYHSASPTTINNAPLLSNGDVVGIAVDFDAGKAWFSFNGTWIGSGNPAAGTNPAFTFTPNTALLASMCFYDDVARATVNFGDTIFSNTAPTGFSSWNVIS
jgi:hypothetical protein